MTQTIDITPTAPPRRILLRHRHSRNAELGFDPTRTIGLRNAFVADITRRFKAVKKLITETVQTNDALGLGDSPSIIRIRIQQAAPPGAFEFARDDRKVTAFMQWLRANDNIEILDLPIGGDRQMVGADAWSNVHIESAYKRGIKRSREELKKAGIAQPLFDDTTDFAIDAAFNRPIHADRVGLLFTRTFNGIVSITEGMEGRISEVLAQGLIDGIGPAQLARRIRAEVDISINRARVLARTEIIRAHHIGSINEFREAGVEGVVVRAEFSTAGDDRVCAQCQALEGQVFTLDAIESLIPVHAQCRCIALPVTVEDLPKGTKVIGATDEGRDIARRAQERDRRARARARRRSNVDNHDRQEGPVTIWPESCEARTRVRELDSVC